MTYGEIAAFALLVVYLLAAGYVIGDLIDCADLCDD